MCYFKSLDADSTKCEELSYEKNGYLVVNGTVVGSYAIYECFRGFGLTGEPIRVCSDTGSWSSEAPACGELILNCQLAS